MMTKREDYYAHCYDMDGIGARKTKPITRCLIGIIRFIVEAIVYVMEYLIGVYLVMAVSVAYCGKMPEITIWHLIAVVVIGTLTLHYIKR